jgi:two-component system chemotaxis response regulator CheB
VTVRVLIAEDSAVTREYLTFLLEADPQIAVVGAARDGEEAVQLAERLLPDVIVMDVHMPCLSGYDATRRIMERVPTPIVLATASSSQEETHSAFHALEAGALVLVDKPPGPDHPDSGRAARELVRTVKIMSEVKVVRRWTRSAPADGHHAPRLERPAARAIAVGASTGGPPVLAQILRGAAFDAPVLVVQHIAAGFTAGFAEWLGTAISRPVELAEDGERARRGVVYVAGAGAHMTLERDGRLGLDSGTPVNGFRPSISRLFESVAAATGPASVGVLLTGMGRDGADGLRRMRDAGALTIAQDEASCAVYGMPAEAARLGAAVSVLAPADIADVLRSLNGRRPA